LLENIKEHFVYPDFQGKSIQRRIPCEENVTVLLFGCKNHLQNQSFIYLWDTQYWFCRSLLVFITAGGGETA